MISDKLLAARWGARRDSNPQHQPPQGCALPLNYEHHAGPRPDYSGFVPAGGIYQPTDSATESGLGPLPWLTTWLCPSAFATSESGPG
jgi:hypothetical protein